MTESEIIKVAIRNYFRMRGVEKHISPAQQDDLAYELSAFVVEAVDKYIAGQLEHGGLITDRDLDKEIRQEVTDLFWYTTAKKLKPRSHIWQQKEKR